MRHVYFVMAAVAAALPAGRAAAQVADDPFNVPNVVVTSHTPVEGGSNDNSPTTDRIYNIFGGNVGALPSSARLANAGDAPLVVNFQRAGATPLSGVRVHVQLSDHNYSSFTLLADADNDGSYETSLVNGAPPTNRFSANSYWFAGPTSATRFSARFAAVASAADPRPEIAELDARPLHAIAPGRAAGPAPAEPGTGLRGEWFRFRADDVGGTPLEKIDAFLANNPAPDATFTATRPQYRASDASSLSQFLGQDAASLGPSGARNQQVGDSVFRLSGFLRIDAPGSYVFSTSSDDASRLRIAGEDVVVNDGTHSRRLIDGQVTFAAPGLYPVEVIYNNVALSFGIAELMAGRPAVNALETDVTTPFDVSELYAVPEPAGAGLMLLGLIGLVGRRRKR